MTQKSHTSTYLKFPRTSYPNRTSSGQALALTTYIESGYESKMKTGVLFVDLSAAYEMLVSYINSPNIWIVKTFSNYNSDKEMLLSMSALEVIPAKSKNYHKEYPKDWY